jgi:hypothetical protein
MDRGRSANFWAEKSKSSKAWSPQIASGSCLHMKTCQTSLSPPNLQPQSTQVKCKNKATSFPMPLTFLCYHMESSLIAMDLTCTSLTPQDSLEQVRSGGQYGACQWSDTYPQRCCHHCFVSLNQSASPVATHLPQVLPQSLPTLYPHWIHLGGDSHCHLHSSR